MHKRDRMVRLRHLEHTKMSITSITTTNFRRFAHPVEFAIKPLTILVGRNSSGKSTLLRLLPLLRQSLTTRTSAPLLWYGDLVDFGDYASVVANHDREQPIEIGFSSRPPTMSRRRLVERNYRPSDSDNFSIGTFRCHYRLGARDRGGKSTTTLRSATIEYPDQKIRLDVHFSEEGRLTAAFIGDQDLNAIIDVTRIRISRKIFAPLNISIARDDRSGFVFGDREFFSSALFSALREIMDRRISDLTLNSFVTRLLFSAPYNFSRVRAAANSAGLVTLVQFVNTYFQYDTQIKKKIKAILDFFFICRASDIHLSVIFDTFSTSLYIGPARVRSDRYYRYQELSVSEILPDGSNLPMFLNSLASPQINDFSNFVERSFGFGVVLDSSGGHISIRLKLAYPVVTHTH